MPRAKGRGALERTAAADLFKHTLSHVPTTFGQLVYLSSLRDSNTGTYRHHGLAARFGRQDSVQALTESHQRVFHEWLLMPLESKYQDLLEYFRDLDEAREDVVRHWRRSPGVLQFAPDSASRAEREHFIGDLGILFELL